MPLTFAAPDAAATLAEIAESRGESFYRGALAERIVTTSPEAQFTTFAGG